MPLGPSVSVAKKERKKEKKNKERRSGFVVGDPKKIDTQKRHALKNSWSRRTKKRREKKKKPHKSGVVV